MKIIGRIVYALLCVIIFWFLFNYAQLIRNARYFENEGSLAIAENNDVFFFGSVYDYYAKTPILFKETEHLLIRVYEVVKKGTDLETYTYIMIGARLDKLPYTMQLVFEDSIIEMDVVQYKGLNLYMPLELNEHQGMSIYTHTIRKSTWLEQPYQQLIVFDETNEIIDQIDISIFDDAFRLEKSLRDYFALHQKWPVEHQIEIDIFIAHQHTYGYLEILGYVMIAYVVMITTTTYFIFFFKRKKLGRNQPSAIFTAEQNKKDSTQN